MTNAPIAKGHDTPRRGGLASGHRRANRSNGLKVIHKNVALCLQSSHCSTAQLLSLCARVCVEGEGWMGREVRRGMGLFALVGKCALGTFTSCLSVRDLPNTFITFFDHRFFFFFGKPGQRKPRTAETENCVWRNSVPAGMPGN